MRAAAGSHAVTVSGDAALPVASARRVVSLVPSHTETLLALGARVVGRTRFCIHPESVAAIPHVGGTKDARLEAILALRPDLVVADRDENPRALVEALQESGVRVVWSDIATVPDAAAFIRVLGQELGGAAQGRADAAAADIADALREAAGAGKGQRVFCPIWHPWMTFDGSAYPSAVLGAVGLANVFAGHAGPRYFAVTDAEVHAAEPAWTLLPTEPFPFHRHRVDTEGLGPAGHADRVRVIDGEALTWFGVRTAPGLRVLVAVARELADAGDGA